MPPPPAFRREMRLFDATAVVVGSMIGSGIFIVSADIARAVSSSGWLLLVWLATGVMTVGAALCYGELASMMPHAGGQYVYLREAFGPLVGFLYGWTLFLVIQSGTIAAVGVAFAKFTAVLVPWFSTGHVLLRVAGRNVSAAQLLAIASIVVLTVVNIFGVTYGRRVQNLFTTAKTLALVGVILAALFLGARADIFGANFAHPWSAARATDTGPLPLAGLALAAAFGAAMVGSLFSSDAWNNITFAAGEVVDPRRTLPRALALGTALVTGLYLLANIAYLVVLPLAGRPDGATEIARGIQYATDDRVGTAIVSVIVGPRGAVVMAALILLSTFGCNNGLILAGARVTWAMARDGLFFRAAGRLNRRSVPGVALVVQAAWASLLCLSGTYLDLLDYVVFAVLLFYILTVIGLIVLRRSRPLAERPFRTPLYPWLPLAYAAAAATVALDLLIQKPATTMPGLGIVAAGIPVYFAWRAFGRRG